MIQYFLYYTVFMMLSSLPYSNAWPKPFQRWMLHAYVIWSLYKNSSIQLLSEWWAYLSRWPLKRWLTCIISAQVAKWTMRFPTMYEMDASPPHMGKSATDHWLRSWQWFLRTHFHKADASWHGAWSQAVHLIAICKYIGRFSNYNGTLMYNTDNSACSQRSL